MLYGLAARVRRAQVFEARRVAPEADRVLVVVRRQLREAPGAQPPVPRLRVSRAFEIRGFRDDEHAVAVARHRVFPGAIVWHAVQYRGPQDPIGRRLVLHARGERGARKNRRSRGAALRELRSHAEGAVQEQRVRVQPVELAVQVVAAAEQREAVPEKIVLEPRFVEPRAPWPGDAAHALRAADEIVGLAAVEPRAVEEARGVRPAEETFEVERGLELQAAVVGRAALRAPRQIGDRLAVVGRARVHALRRPLGLGRVRALRASGRAMPGEDERDDPRSDPPLRSGYCGPLHGEPTLSYDSRSASQ